MEEGRGGIGCGGDGGNGGDAEGNGGDAEGNGGGAEGNGGGAEGNGGGTEGNGGGVWDVAATGNSKNVFAGSQSSEPSTCIMVSEWMTPPSTRIDTHSRSAGPR